VLVLSGFQGKRGSRTRKPTETTVCPGQGWACHWCDGRNTGEKVRILSLLHLGKPSNPHGLARLTRTLDFLLAAHWASLSRRQHCQAQIKRMRQRLVESQETKKTGWRPHTPLLGSMCCFFLGLKVGLQDRSNLVGNKGSCACGFEVEVCQRCWFAQRTRLGFYFLHTFGTELGIYLSL